MAKRSLNKPEDKVCINGDLGSGKTTAAKMLAQSLKYEFYSTGLVQRQIAQRLGISTLELNKRSEIDRSFDDEIDDVLKSLASDIRQLVIDSRMGWFFIPRSLKIRLVCHPLTSATRLFNDKSRDAEKYLDINQAENHISARRASERKRFFDLYSVSVEDITNYDLIIQTDFCSRAQVVDLLVEHMRGLRRKSNRLVLSPRLVFPLDHVRNLARPPYQNIDKNFASSNKIIDVIYCDDCFFVVDGHKRLATALNAGADSIIASVRNIKSLPTGMNQNEYVNCETSLARVYDWEDAFNFKFPFYPKNLK